MKIVAAAVEAWQGALRRPLVTARGTLVTRDGFVLRLTNEAGTIGAGEASPAHWIGESSLERTEADLRRIVALVRERPSLEDLRARGLDPRNKTGLSPAAACALDSALVDLVARARGEAAAVVLGGTAPAPVAIAALVAGETIEALLREVDVAVTRGFTTLKIKVGSASISEDLRRVATVRARVGPSVHLRLDANRAWSAVDARVALEGLLPIGVAYVEEPLRNADPAELAALTRATSVPVAVDESIVGIRDLERVLVTGARLHVVLKAARVGGPTRLLALARHAEAAGLPVVVTDSIESALGVSVALHTAAALPGPCLAVGLGGAQLLGDEEPAPSLIPHGPGWTIARGPTPALDAQRA